MMDDAQEPAFPGQQPAGDPVDYVLACLKRNLAEVEERLSAACRRSGRKRSAVTVVAVTKSVDAAIAARLPTVDIHDLGESRPQELWRKAAALPRTVQWHLIGHLQRNKVEATLRLVRLIHSVDSPRLLAALEEEAARQDLHPAVLLEFNLIRDPARHGFVPEDLTDLISQLRGVRRLQVRGLMTMAAFEENPERCRPTFAGLRQLRERLQTELGTVHRLEELSMGMSNDFDIAVEEGATLVRLGTILFQGLGEQPS
jgi:pyridoxal phosphate enzyme (YggS family)